MDLDDREMLFSRDGLFCTIHFKMDHHEPAITQVTQVFSRRLPQCISLGVRGGADVMVGINSTQCMLPARALALLAPHDLPSPHSWQYVVPEQIHVLWWCRVVTSLVGTVLEGSLSTAHALR